MRMNLSVTNRTFLAIALTAWVAGAPAAARAEVKPNSLFSDGAVLQQGVAVPVWGTAKDGEKVTVKFQQQTVTTTAKDGRWLVRLKPLKAGGPFTLTRDRRKQHAGHLQRAGRRSLAVQRAVEHGLSTFARRQRGGGHRRRRRPATAAVHRAARRDRTRPTTDAPGSWAESSPETAAKFSAVAWFFGRDLRRARNVPVGLINSSVGGTPAEAWTSRARLEADPELKQILERYAESVKNVRSRRRRRPAQAGARRTQSGRCQGESRGRAAAPGAARPGGPAPGSWPALRPLQRHDCSLAALRHRRAQSGIRASPTRAARPSTASCSRR